VKLSFGFHDTPDTILYLLRLCLAWSSHLGCFCCESQATFPGTVSLPAQMELNVWQLDMILEAVILFKTEASFLLLLFFYQRD